MFPEGANGGINAASSTTATPINVGWDPIVTEVIANWDGGKTMAGFGKISGTMYGAWVIKMWGAKGTTSCGDNSAITGYVQMVMGLTADLSTSANCSLGSFAKVQWAWTNVAATGITVDANKVSWVITSATEEYMFGGTGDSAVGDDSYIIIVGGATSDTW